jgi:hypothetical protein
MVTIDDPEEPALGEAKDLDKLDKCDDPDQVDVEYFIIDITITIVR